MTGATGFVGSHAVDELLESGYRVRCLVRATSKLRWLEGKPVELVVGDLLSGDLAAAVDGVDKVIHCAGLTRGSPEALRAANQRGTLALVKACCESDGKPRFVLCSSQAAAGPSRPGRPRAVEDPPAPTSDYGRSKLAAEREALGAGDRIGVVIVRPGAVYGPRDEDTLPYFKMAAHGVVIAPGVRRRLVQVVHARDAAQALRLAAERAVALGNTYFVAHPQVLTWSQLARAIGRATGRRTLTVRLPAIVLRGAGALMELLGRGGAAGELDGRRARDLIQRAWTCGTERTQRELGWSPHYDSEDGLRATAEWYRAQGWL
ncbi:MAG: NAD-dependent epimerase/dehydratase family protein [Gemmatimonadota bacterium]|nr:MAG: NAD-dependent epimerase/dehydratase family protein [Gemmatimonadota bacterium]